jgi:hypothetical protein
MNEVKAFWAWLTVVPRGFMAWVHTAFCALMTEEGRKAWALLMAWGCSVAMTAFTVAVLWFVRKSPMLTFWLGLCAMGIIFVVITGIMVLLGVRRSTHLKHGDSDFSIDDQSPPTT